MGSCPQYGEWPCQKWQYLHLSTNKHTCTLKMLQISRFDKVVKLGDGSSYLFHPEGASVNDGIDSAPVFVVIHIGRLG